MQDQKIAKIVGLYSQVTLHYHIFADDM